MKSSDNVNATLTGRISVIVPAKNEADCLPAMLAELPRDLLHEIIVVDGNSIDGTRDVAENLGYQVIEQEGDGYGMAVSTGLKHASGEFITFIDADGSYNPSALSEMLERIDAGFDVIFCSRYLPESGSDDDTIIRFIGNKVFTLALRWLHGVKITDALFLYVLARREVFDRISMRTKKFDWCIEFPVRVQVAGLSYTEIPSRERPRLAGVSKVNAFFDGINILLTMIKLKIQR